MPGDREGLDGHRRVFELGLTGYRIGRWADQAINACDVSFMFRSLACS